MQLRYPTDTINIKKLFNASTHRGVDIGWFSDTPDEDLFAVGDGVVVEVRNDCNSTTPGSGTYGNYVKIKHDNNVYSLYAHCKYNCSRVKVGDIVKQHQLINTLGNTGDSYGPHCHFEIWEGSTKVDPLKYLRVYPGQTIYSNSIKKDLQYYEEPYKYVGTPVPANEEVDQLEIFNNILFARDTPNGNKLGYANVGIYNVHNVVHNGDYDWVEIEPNMWVARNDEWNEYIPKKEVPVEPEPTIPEEPQEEPKEQGIFIKLIQAICNLFIDIINVFKKD